MFFAVTGITEIPHNELRKIANSNGHHMGDFVNERTNFLIANYESKTKKYSNALKYNIPIITEKEFKKIIKEKVKCRMM